MFYVQIAEFRAKRAASSPSTADGSPAAARSVMAVDHVTPAPPAVGSSATTTPVTRTLVMPGASIAGAGAVLGGGVVVDSAIVAEKDATIRELKETVEILELKIKKLEQLVKLKDQRIQTLSARLQAPAQAASS